MIDRDHDLPMARQAKVLKLARSTVYYMPRPVSAGDLALMRRLDELHLDYPFAGARMLRSLLRREGVSVGRRHVTTLMKRMGISAIYRRPNTSKPAPGHRIYPYLLRGLKVGRPNQVWAMDLSYIPMRRGIPLPRGDHGSGDAPGIVVAPVEWFGMWPPWSEAHAGRTSRTDERASSMPP